MFGIRLPVGRQAEDATGLEFASHQFDERRLHDAALVVTLLGPRIRKIEQHLVERCVRHPPLQDLHGVVADHAHVAELPCFAAQQQVSDTGRMNLEAEVIAFGMAGCQRDERLAVAEADFEHHRRDSAEGGREIERFLAIFDAERGPQLAPGAFLCAGHAACAHDKAADRAVVRRVGRRRCGAGSGVGDWLR